MSWRERILTNLALGPHELRPLLALTLANFLLMFSYVAAKTVRDSVLLARFDLQHLPYIYIAAAVLLALLFTGSNWLRERVPARRLMAATYGVITAVLVGFHGFLKSDSPLAPALFYVWVVVYGGVVFGQFWVCFHAVTSARGSHRMVTLVASGALAGQIVAGLLVERLARGHLARSAEDLIWLVIVSLLLSAVAMGRAMRLWGDQVLSERRLETDVEPLSRRTPLQEIAAVPYLRSLALFICGGVAAETVVDFLFKVTVQATVAPEELTRFFGLFFTAVGVVALVVQLVVTPRLLRRYGVAATVLFLPLLLLGTGSLVVLLPALLAAVLLKGGDVATRTSVHKSAVELLYQPLRLPVRRRVKPTLDAVSERSGDAIGGLVILAALQLGLGRAGFLWLLLALVVLWLAAGRRVRLNYVRTLRSRLSAPQRSADSAENLLDDADSFAALLRVLNSPRAEEVIQALELFEAYDRPETVPTVLLAHRDPDVRLRTLQLMRDAGRDDYFGFLDLLLEDDDSRVRHLALATLADTDSRFALQRVDRFTDDADPVVRAAVGYCLLKLGDSRQRRDGRHRLDRLRRGEPVERLVVAWTLGRSSERLPLQWLADLLRDANLAVRRAAAAAALRHRDLDLVEPLCELLFSDRTAPAAHAALVALEDAAVPRLLEVYGQHTAGWLRLKVVAVLRAIGTPTAAAALLVCLEQGEEWIGIETLQALVELQRAGDGGDLDRGRLDEILARDEYRLGFYLARLETLTISPGSDRSYAQLLRAEVNERADACLERCCQALELMFPAREILAAFGQYRDGDPVARANAVAFLDAVLPRARRRRVIEFMEQLPLAQRLQRAQVPLPATVAVALRSLAAGDDDLLRVLVLAAAGDYRAAEKIGPVVVTTPGAPRILREAVAQFGDRTEGESA